MKKSKVSGCLGKIFRTIIFLLFAPVILKSVLTGIESFFSDSEGTASLAKGFTISAYKVTLDVGLDNKINVTEDITVDWNSTSHHGILKFTPEWLKYTGKDGKTIKRKSIVSNLASSSDPYTTDRIKKKARIRLGSPDKYVELGEKTYSINYVYNMGKDPYKGFDEFIFHAFGDYWGTEIRNAEVEINMPKNIEGYNVNFFMDKTRNYNVADYVDYIIEGNKLHAKFNQERHLEAQKLEYCSNSWNIDSEGNCIISDYQIKKLNKSFTVDIELPEGYFVGGSWNYGLFSLLISIVIFTLTGLSIFNWYKYGKNYPKQIKTIEFYPPQRLSSAEVGFIYGKHTSKKLTISLIVQLASKGYIKIEEIPNGKDKQIQITNLHPKPFEPITNNDKVQNRNIRVKKIKDADDASLSRKELVMMSYLFKTSDIKLLRANINKFLAVKDTLIKKGFIEVLEDNEFLRFTEADSEKEEYEKSREQYRKLKSEYDAAILQLPSLGNLEQIVYHRLFINDDVVILRKHLSLYRAFYDVEDALNQDLKDLIHDKLATKKMWSLVLSTIIVLVLSIISYKYVADLDPSWSILYRLSFGCVLLNFTFIFFMKRKTKYGEELIARVLGFREFLVTAEKDKLEALVEENPNYFYDILPYTYVLNISKKWIKKFENIKMPEIDMGRLNNSKGLDYIIYESISHPVAVSSSSCGSSGGSSGGSSCGGGCSSGGGGCSSCGGGSSW